MSRHFMPETLLLLSQQGYTARPKADGGYQIQSPPGGSPDYRSFSISEPKNHHDETVIRNRLSRAGVKFTEDKIKRSEKPLATNNPAPPRVKSDIADNLFDARGREPAGRDDFELIIHRIEIATAALADIEVIITRIRKRVDKAQKLREMLKDFAE